jgi:hypothetical protein
LPYDWPGYGFKISGIILVTRPWLTPTLCKHDEFNNIFIWLRVKKGKSALLFFSIFIKFKG